MQSYFMEMFSSQQRWVFLDSTLVHGGYVSTYMVSTFNITFIFDKEKLEEFFTRLIYGTNSVFG